MRHVSIQRQRRNTEARPVREQLIREVGMCEVCRRQRMPEWLCCHELGRARGAVRRQALDKRFALLVVCLEPDYRHGTDCHDLVQHESECRQLARLSMVRGTDYDLVAYLSLTSPRAPFRIEQSDVDREVRELTR